MDEGFAFCNKMAKISLKPALFGDPLQYQPQLVGFF